METQQNLSGVTVPVRGEGSISTLSNSVETPEVTLTGYMLATTRLLLAFTLVVLATGSGRLSGANSEIITVILWSYFFYSAALGGGLLANLQGAKSVQRYAALLDLCFFAVLMMLTKDTSSLLFIGFGMCLLSSYHSDSRNVGLTVMVLAAGIVAADLFFNFGSIGFALLVQPRLAETAALVGAPLILGIVAFYWKGQKARFERRVELMLGASDFSNPRFGAAWSLSTLLEKIGTFYEADDCLFIESFEGGAEYRIHRQKVGASTSSILTETISQECAAHLLVVPETHAFVLSRSRVPILRRRYTGYDVITRKRQTNGFGAAESMLTLLEAESIISVPVLQADRATGRIFLTSTRKSSFSISDILFFSQFVRQYLPLIENLRLVENLRKAAGDLERRHIALDMHDNVVQPYIGIQLGLGAIRQKVQGGRMDISEDLERLIAIAEMEINGLRRYMSELCAEVKHQGQFLPAVQRLTEKFAATTGIAVEVKTSKDIDLNDKLAAETFQMIAEGLSNIRRHTAASEAMIEINCNRKNLHLSISNNGRNGEAGEFIPKSITARAASLGGEVRIDLGTYGKTVLNIGIPFQA